MEDTQKPFSELFPGLMEFEQQTNWTLKKIASPNPQESLFELETKVNMTRSDMQYFHRAAYKAAKRLVDKFEEKCPKSATDPQDQAAYDFMEGEKSK